jgi:hypothetical protein
LPPAPQYTFPPAMYQHPYQPGQPPQWYQQGPPDPRYGAPAQGAAGAASGGPPGGSYDADPRHPVPGPAPPPEGVVPPRYMFCEFRPTVPAGQPPGNGCCCQPRLDLHPCRSWPCDLFVSIPFCMCLGGPATDWPTLCLCMRGLHNITAQIMPLCRYCPAARQAFEDL